MPTGKHEAVLNGMKATLAAIAPGGGYNFDLTGTDQVSRSQLRGREGDWPLAVWVHPGGDEWEVGTNSPRAFNVGFAVAATLLLHDEDLDPEELEKALERGRYDVLRAVLNNQQLGGTCTDTVPQRAAEPGYDYASKRAELTLEFVAVLTDLGPGAL